MREGGEGLLEGKVLVAKTGTLYTRLGGRRAGAHSHMQRT